jgi:acyl-CoA reductase-like NAD-dependent aldehyde dehydrogenase
LPTGAWCRLPNAAISSRQIGEKLREFRDPLGRLVTLETGKSLQEGLDEVQEMVDTLIVTYGVTACIRAGLSGDTKSRCRRMLNLFGHADGIHRAVLLAKGAGDAVALVL